MRKLLFTLLVVNGIWYIISIVGVMTSSTSDMWMQSLVGAFITSVFIGVLAAVMIIFQDVQEDEVQETSASMPHPVVSASMAQSAAQSNDVQANEADTSNSSDVDIKVKESTTEWPF